MRTAAWTLCAILAAGACLSAGTPDARADSSSRTTAAQTQPAPLADGALPALPATRAEERAYAQRESAAPAAVKEYGGGFIVAVLVVIALVFLIVYLVQRT